MKIIKVCEYEIKLYWHHLSLVFAFIILTLTFALQGKHKLIYVPFSCGVCSLIVFLNFPSIVIALHSRPIYYDDLIIKDYNEDESNKLYDDEFRRKYQKIFRIIIATTSSVMVAVTTELWYFRNSLFSDGDNSRSQTVSFVVILGVLGGMLRIYYGATMMIGKSLMIILKILKKREQKSLRQHEQQQIVYEMTKDGITVSSDEEFARGTGRRSRQISLNMERNEDDAPMLRRSNSCDDIKVVGFKPNLTAMNDIFN